MELNENPQYAGIVFSAQKSTLVNFSKVGKILHPNETNLILSKNCELEIHRVTEEGIENVLTLPVNGKIVDFQIFRPNSFIKDIIIILTVDWSWFIVEYCTDSKTFETLSYGKIEGKEYLVNVNLSHPKILISPQSRLIGFHIFHGKLLVSPYEYRVIDDEDENKGTHHRRLITGKVRDLKIPFLDIIDIQFLKSLGPGKGKPTDGTFAMIYYDKDKRTHLRVYEVEETDRKIKMKKSCQNIPGNPKMIVPCEIPFGGFLLIGEEKILYFSDAIEDCPSSGICGIDILDSGSTITCFDMITNDRYIMGDALGRLFLVVLRAQNQKSFVSKLEIMQLGVVKSPVQAISYIDNSFCFVSLKYENSLLIQLRKTKYFTKNFFKVTRTRADNICPIVDICLVNEDYTKGSKLDTNEKTQKESNEKEETRFKKQQTIVSCSGHGEYGSICIVRNGIGIENITEEEIGSGIRGVFTLFEYIEDDEDEEKEKEKMKDEETSIKKEDEYIVFSFSDQSVILGRNDEGELGKQNIKGFDIHNETLFCSTTPEGYFLQITKNGVFLISPPDDDDEEEGEENKEEEGVVCDWKEENSVLLGGCVQNLDIIVFKNKNEICLLELSESENSIKKIGQSVIKNTEITCAAFGKLKNSNGVVVSEILIVGCWDGRVRIFEKNNLDEIRFVLNLSDISDEGDDDEGSNFLPRSVLFNNFENINYVFVSLGNGNLSVYQYSEKKNVFFLTKKISLGSKSGKLKKMRISGEKVVVVGSDRPVIISSKHNQLGFNFMNTSGVQNLHKYNISVESKIQKELDSQNYLIFIYKNKFMVGRINEIHKFHTLKYNIREQPWRITECENKFIVFTSLKNEVQKRDNRSIEVGYLNCFNINKIENVKSSSIDSSNVFEIDKDLKHCLGESIHGSSLLYLKKLNLIIVGCTVVKMDEIFPKEGRLMFFSLNKKTGKIKKISERETKGGVTSMSKFKKGDKYFVASINQKVQIFKVVITSSNVDEEGRIELTEECSYPGHILTNNIRVHDEYIYFTDVLKSIQLLKYSKLINMDKNDNSPTSGLRLTAYDYKIRDLMCLESVDKDNVLMSDYCGNIVLFNKEIENFTLNQKFDTKMKPIRRFNYNGDIINVIRKGNIVMRDLKEYMNLKTFIFGTISGAIGVLVLFPPSYRELYKFLTDLQHCILEEVNGIGKLESKNRSSGGLSFRQSDEEKDKGFGYFLDGDFLEIFLKLNEERQKRVLEKLKANEGSYRELTLLEVKRRIEELSRNVH